jgi:hypothetical protein
MKVLGGDFIIELKGNGLVKFNLFGQSLDHVVLRGKFRDVTKDLGSVTLQTIGDQDYAAFDAQLEEFLEKVEEADEYSFQFGGQPSEQWPILICQYIK